MARASSPRDLKYRESRSVDEDIAHLRDLDLSGLRGRWQSVTGRPAAQHIGRHLLFAMLAYRLQAEAPCLRGTTDQHVGTVKRVPAKEIELAVTRAVIASKNSDPATQGDGSLNREALASIIARIEVLPSQLTIHLRARIESGQGDQDNDLDRDAELAQQPLTEARVLIIPWKKASIAREVLRPAKESNERIKPIKIGPRVALIRSIALGRQWLERVAGGTATVVSLAAEHGCGFRHPR